MNIKTVWIFDTLTRFLVGASFAQECQFTLGEWLTPDNSTESRPHLDEHGREPEGKRNHLETDGATWTLVDVPQPVPEPEPTLTPEQLTAVFIGLIQQRLDDFARTRKYDGILSACTYATSTVPKFLAEGQACVALRDATWAAAYEILAQVQNGVRVVPASLADIESDLPVLAWPAGSDES